MIALPLWLLIASFAIAGAIWGSFVGALCSRWPIGDTIATGRSRCDHCKKTIAGYDLVPIASYLVLRGKCRDCGREIGARAIAIELAAAFIGAAAVIIFPVNQAWAAAIFGWLLLPLILLDYWHLWLPNRLVLLLATGGFLFGPVLLPEVMLSDRIIAGFVGFLILEAIRLIYRQYRQQDGMGAGDPKLFGALGLWLGWEALPITLLLASAIGVAFAVVMQFSVRPHGAVYPFGSYLSVAALLTGWTGSG